MKPEIIFGLESAAWPALLVDGNGVIMRANSSASAAFGAVLSGEAPLLSAIWPAENGTTAVDFLTHWERSPTPVVNLKFRAPNGPMVACTVSICTFAKDSRKWFVFQLLPLTTPPSPTNAPAAPAASPLAEGKTEADAGLTLKQRLDCALQLARTMSLDFNNALTSILGHTSFLLSKAEPGHPWRHSLMEVEKSASKAAEIANELAMFSQHERQQTRRVPPGNLNEVTQRCVEFFRNANAGQIIWHTQFERELFAVRFDEAKVQQALTKILENAVEALNGAGQIAVQTRSLELTEPTQDGGVRLNAGTYVCVEIVDNGRGIEADVLSRIFEPFFTTKGSSHRGLGLALVYGIMTNHGGGVAVSSQPGSGTSTRVYLPAEKQLVRESADTEENLNGTETVLVVDDEDILLTMAETILSEYGYHVLMANSAQKALAMLSRDDVHVDLVVTDLVMPTMGGREFVERIHQLLPKIRILCASGCVLPPDQQIGLLFLQKPYTSRELLGKVRQALVTEPAAQSAEHNVD
ncbi:MAG TPA: ATP-binding protein [Candidatus Limnocylindrales bacterium]|nr:ATP-binding protein [Candidatus Limnocylindrales bacterium]